jgi:hypothetical protein
MTARDTARIVTLGLMFIAFPHIARAQRRIVEP